MSLTRPPATRGPLVVERNAFGIRRKAFASGRIDFTIYSPATSFASVRASPHESVRPFRPNFRRRVRPRDTIRKWMKSSKTAPPKRKQAGPTTRLKLERGTTRNIRSGSGAFVAKDLVKQINSAVIFEFVSALSSGAKSLICNNWRRQNTHSEHGQNRVSEVSEQ